MCKYECKSLIYEYVFFFFYSSPIHLFADIFFSFTGPLLYHFENLSNEESIEISYEVLRRVIQDMGFLLLVSGSINCINNTGYLYRVAQKECNDFDR